MADATMASTMARSPWMYRDYKDVPRCVRHDIARLASLGLVREHGGKVHAAGLVDVPEMSH